MVCTPTQTFIMFKKINELLMLLSHTDVISFISFFPVSLTASQAGVHAHWEILTDFDPTGNRGGGYRYSLGLLQITGSN